MRGTWLSANHYWQLNLICATVASFILYTMPAAGGWPLLLFLLPSLGHFVATGRWPNRRTPLDWFLLLFLITALGGIWAAYNRPAALAAFWLLLGAVLLCYAVAQQPAEALLSLLSLLTIVAGLLALFFLLSHNWDNVPASVAVLDRLALAWLRIRPSLPLSEAPDAAEGIMVLLLPLAVARALIARHAADTVWLIIATVAALLVGLGLLFTTSLGAWAALLAAGLVAILWQREGNRPLLLLAAFLLLLTTLLLVSWPAGARSLTATLPGESIQGRLALANGARALIGDFLFTGGGLGAFPGLYSRYILLLPVPFVSHSRNLWLDVALGQGVMGLLAMLGVMAICLFLLAQPEKIEQSVVRRLLGTAIVASLIAMMVHGLADDPFYSDHGALFLFFVPGLVLALRQEYLAWLARRCDYWLPRLLALGIVVFLLGLAFYRPLAASFKANLVAVAMARIELAAWPDLEWHDSSQLPALASVEDQLQAALATASGLRSAQQRLGMLAMLRFDYEVAIRHLVVARQLDPDHRGVQKALGYSYVWVGDFARADPLLADLPEAEAEMATYSWWWETQGQPTLARLAADYIESRE